MWEYILLFILLVVVGAILYNMRGSIVRTITGGGILQPTKSEGVNTLKEFLTKYRTSAMLILSNGKPVFKYGDITKPTVIASCRKSILSMLYGVYNIDLNLTIGELGIDDINKLTQTEKTATLKHLLTATSGIYHPASNGGDDTKYAPPRGTYKPGEFHLYNNWDFNAAGTAFEKVTGVGIYDAFYEKLVKPLGLEDFDMGMHKKGGDLLISIHPSYHFFLSARDMSKLGQLMLNKGEWDGIQIIPKKWVDKSTSLHTPTSKFIKEKMPTVDGYGYLWWVNEMINKKSLFYGSYSARGYGGQMVGIYPNSNLVIAHKVFNERGGYDKMEKPPVPFNTLNLKILDLFG